ncbi:MarR family winged helix-turn-helix transcriptional regulator [Sporolactobacillus pectinivorans]|uniref:MarR family winged helix-turn-helix transcriptional regulator n=1 Tax=Sporolactobacillus pectinivorans TaxID=1591408 RepID=UPI0012FE4848|nr:MarR family transcriptional regulator [Sporolactobacillus pectinivorans]
MFYRLHLVSKEMNQAFESMAHTSLTKLEILCSIHSQEEMAQLELIKRLKLDAAAVTRHLKHMEEEGSIRRRKDDKDKRLIWLALTEKGETERERLVKIKAMLQKKLLSDFTNEQIICVSQFIEKVSQNINSRIEV